MVEPSAQFSSVASAEAPQFGNGAAGAGKRLPGVAPGCRRHWKIYIASLMSTLSSSFASAAGVHAVYVVAAALMAAGAWLVSREIPHAQNTPRYIEQPAHTSGGGPSTSADRKAW